MKSEKAGRTTIWNNFGGGVWRYKKLAKSKNDTRHTKKNTAAASQQNGAFSSS
jgi:hypothetical protein